MFKFLSEDWFVVSLEIVFLLFIIYDVRRYFQTQKREYLVNIAVTLVFFIWTAVPFYKSYITWSMGDKKELVRECVSENNETLCECLSGAISKEYTFESYKDVDKNSSEYLEFIKESKEDCLDDSWF